MDIGSLIMLALLAVVLGLVLGLVAVGIKLLLEKRRKR